MSIRNTALKIYQTMLSGNFPNELDNIADSQDRAFCKRLVFTALRQQEFIKNYINGYSSKKLPQKLAVEHLIIILGAVEILFFSTPEYAAVNSYVELAKKFKNKYCASFVNAILRKFCQNKNSILAQNNGIILPKKFAQLLQQDYTPKEITKIVETVAKEPPLDITVKNSPETWAKNLNAQQLPNNSVRIFSAGNITHLHGYEQGEWWVQDFSSSLAIQVLDNIRNKNILELCAAPGGKTAQLLNSGAIVTSVEISSSRIKILEQNLKRLNLQPKEIICADAIDFLQNNNKTYDIIVLDAPCSATGTLRRHPEIMHTRTIKDVDQNAVLQKKLLEAASPHLSENGILLYSVCSLSKAEGEKQIIQFIDSHPEFRIMPISFSSLSLEQQQEMSVLLTKEGFVRCLPYHFAHIGGIDGFFVAKLQKRKNL
ncbi:MAG: hypothetical protein J6T72_00225 [Alphaproteobacteria bacterium]|nr:hypothetical protein [Alphaproteobacteria bacterium]